MTTETKQTKNYKDTVMQNNYVDKKVARYNDHKETHNNERCKTTTETQHNWEQTL